MQNYDLIIVGGGAAGITAMIEARKFNFNAKILLISAEKKFYSKCALPFLISNEVKTEKISQSVEQMCKSMNVDFVFENAIAIDIKNKSVKTKNSEFFYKSLVIATGSYCEIPKIPGVDREGVFTLKSLEDAEKIKSYAKKCKSALVVGSGATGIEIAVSLKKLNLNVTIVEISDAILPFCLSKDFSEIVAKKLKENGIKLLTNSKIEKILGDIKVQGAIISGNEVSTDMIVFCTGLKPNIKIAKEAGIKVDKGILVDEKMQTSINGIFAAGDCAQIKDRITSEKILSQLGTTAIREAEIAALNALGANENLSQGIMNSLVMKIFDLQVGKTGLNEQEAKAKGFEIFTGKVKTLTKEEYFPEAKELLVKLIFSKKDLRILGCEILGYEHVATLVDLIAFAILKNSTLDDFEKFDYCYNPAVIPAHNALVLAAKNARKKLKYL
ncbi:MAG: FAD-dependent oxidoreductase [Candidatus Altiarchaeota archaeon]